MTALGWWIAVAAWVACIAWLCAVLRVAGRTDEWDGHVADALEVAADGWKDARVRADLIAWEREMQS